MIDFKNVKCGPFGVGTVPQSKTPYDPRSSYLPPDQAPWVEVARRVLAGDYERSGESERKSLEIGLKAVNDPICARALERLRSRAGHGPKLPPPLKLAGE